MKPFYLILLLLCGCSTTPKTQPVAQMAMPRLPSIVVTAKPLTWTWNPGGYSNFVVVTSTELTTPLLQWPTYAIMTGTNFQASSDDSQRFFSLYGTNVVTGENAWVEK